MARIHPDNMSPHDAMFKSNGLKYKRSSAKFSRPEGEYFHHIYKGRVNLPRLHQDLIKQGYTNEHQSRFKLRFSRTYKYNKPNHKVTVIGTILNSYVGLAHDDWDTPRGVNPS